MLNQKYFTLTKLIDFFPSLIRFFKGVRVLLQPKPYQIVNYNIYPAVELQFSTSQSSSITVQASLIYKPSPSHDEVLDISGGFTNGEVSVLKVCSNEHTITMIWSEFLTKIKRPEQLMYPFQLCISIE